MTLELLINFCLILIWIPKGSPIGSEYDVICYPPPEENWQIHSREFSWNNKKFFIKYLMFNNKNLTQILYYKKWNTYRKLPSLKKLPVPSNGIEGTIYCTCYLILRMGNFHMQSLHIKYFTYKNSYVVNSVCISST